MRPRALPTTLLLVLAPACGSEAPDPTPEPPRASQTDEPRSTDEETDAEGPLADLPELSGVHAAEEVVALLEERTGAVRAAPEDGAAWLRLGMAYDAHQLFHLAEPCYRGATRYAPENAKAWYHLARVLAEQSAMDEAIAAMQRSIEVEGSHPPSHWRLGFWLLDVGRSAEAEAAFERSVELDPSGESRDDAGRIGLARIHLEEGRGAEAAEVLESLLERSPDNDYARQLVASAYRQLGRLEDAERELAAAQFARPVWYDTWKVEVDREGQSLLDRLDVARNEIRAGRGDEAIATLEKLLRQNPGNIAVLSTLTPAYVQSGRIDDAIAVNEAALGGRDEQYRIHQNLALLYPQRDEPEKALEHAQRAAELNPVFGEAHAQRGKLLLDAGRTEEAHAALVRARECGDAHPSTTFALARAQAAVEDWDGARASLENLVRSSASLSEPFALLARVRAEFGDADGAWNAWREARRRGHDAAALDALAETLEDRLQ